MLNSLTDTNTEDIVARVRQLMEREVIPRIAKDRENREARKSAESDAASDDKSDEASNEASNAASDDKSEHKSEPYIAHLTKQLVSAASAQVLYTASYATVLKSLVTSGVLDAATCKDITQRVIDTILSVDVSTINKMNAKGYGCFVAHLHLEGLVERPALETYTDRWVDALRGTEGQSHSLENEMAVCELLVHICLTLSKTSIVRDLWRSRMRNTVAPLWETDGVVGMRVKMRLWDVRDAFAL